MFWSSVFGGLGLLLHWQTYVAGLEFILIVFAPLLAFAKGNVKAGCVGMLLQPAFGVIASIVFIWTLMPIIFGVSKDAAWSLPWATLVGDPWYWTKTAFFLVILQICIAFVPLVGGLQTVHTMVSGSIIMVIAISSLHAAVPNMFPVDFSIYPGFWTMVGFLVVGGAAAWGAVVLSTISATLLGNAAPAITMVLPVLGSAFGFLPVFMYGAYLGNQLVKI